MTENELMTHLRTLNPSELFYRNYRLAKSSEIGFQDFLEHVDREAVARDNLLIPEWPQTIPPEYLEDWYFTPDQREGIHVFKHNCYTPAPTIITSLRCSTCWKGDAATGSARTARCCGRATFA